MTTRRVFRVAETLAIVLLVVLAGTVTGFAKTLRVAADGSGNYRTIQSAIAAAASGDEVYVAAGTYQEAIRLASRVTVRGAGMDTVTLTFGGADSTVTAYGVEAARLEGMAIRHSGNAEEPAIFVATSSVTIAECDVSSSGSTSIMVWARANAILEGNVIKDGKGAGVYIGDVGTHATLRRNQIYRNGNGGIEVGASATAAIENNTIAYNTWDGVWVYSGATATITNNIIVWNEMDGVDVTAPESGGSKGAAILSYNDVWGNAGHGYDGLSKPKTDISANPMFVDVAQGDFHLRPGSPCIRAGAGGADMGAWAVLNQLPAAAFVWQALSASGEKLSTEPRAGDRVYFDASASADTDGTISSYEWDWQPDGTFDTKTTRPTVEHTFGDAGTHRVTLRVTDNQGGTAQVTKVVTVLARQATQPPQAAFTFSPPQPSVVGKVQFTDQSSDSDGQVTAWKWEFGDGTTSTERNPSHTYSRRGTFTVGLTVTDNAGLTGLKTQPLTIANLPPIASFSYEPSQPTAGVSIRFDASASTDRDGQIRSYAWDFNGDGKTDAATAQATWTAPGEAKTFTAVLTVTDNDGATGETRRDVAVAETPVEATRSAPATSTSIMTLRVSPVRLYAPPSEGVAVARGADGQVTIRPMQPGAVATCCLPIDLPPLSSCEALVLTELRICYRAAGPADAIGGVEVGFLTDAGSFRLLAECTDSGSSQSWECFAVPLNAAIATRPLLVRLKLKLGSGIEIGECALTYAPANLTGMQAAISALFGEPFYSAPARMACAGISMADNGIAVAGKAYADGDALFQLSVRFNNPCSQDIAITDVKITEVLLDSSGEPRVVWQLAPVTSGKRTVKAGTLTDFPVSGFPARPGVYRIVAETSAGRFTAFFYLVYGGLSLGE